uniref:Uncharacterized protein n=1 Tax=Cacopsylla melanoneura TaxID=428564 RepID=A0A8D9EAD6_9HEMI
MKLMKVFPTIFIIFTAYAGLEARPAKVQRGIAKVVEGAATGVAVAGALVAAGGLALADRCQKRAEKIDEKEKAKQLQRVLDSPKREHGYEAHQDRPYEQLQNQIFNERQAIPNANRLHQLQAPVTTVPPHVAGSKPVPTNPNTGQSVLPNDATPNNSPYIKFGAQTVVIDPNTGKYVLPK